MLTVTGLSLAEYIYIFHQDKKLFMNEYLNFPGKELNVPIIQSNNFFKKKQRNQSQRIINLFPSCYAFLKFPNRMEINL